MAIDILKIKNSSELSSLNEDVKIARYFSYEKLVDFLAGRLFFCNCEFFYDSHERQRIERGNFKNQIALDIGKRIHQHQNKKCTAYVSCWTLFKEENVALWKIYDKESTGACIVTTIGKLKKQLGDNVLLGAVMYDENAQLPFIDIEQIASNYIATEFVKIRPYFFEEEVRAVFYSKTITSRICCELDSKSLIDEVFLSPFANEENLKNAKAILLKEIEENKIKKSIISETAKRNM